MFGILPRDCNLKPIFTQKRASVDPPRQFQPCCHHTQANAPRLNPSWWRLVLDLPTPEGWKAELTWVPWLRPGRESNPWPLGQKSDALPLRHQDIELNVSVIPFEVVGWRYCHQGSGGQCGDRLPPYTNQSCGSGHLLPSLPLSSPRHQIDGDSEFVRSQLSLHWA